MRRAVLGVAACLGLSGCVLPFAVPPLQLQAGGGTRSGAPANKPQSPADGPVLQVRAGVHPMQMGRGWLRRRFDVGAGYVLDTVQSPTLHGAYLEWAAVPAIGNVGQSGVARLLVRGQGRIMLDPDRFVVGRGLTLQATGEVASFADGPFESRDRRSSTFGHAYGEGGIGLYVEGSYLQMGGVDIVSLGAGLTFRIPSAVGLVIGWP